MTVWYVSSTIVSPGNGLSPAAAKLWTGGELNTVLTELANGDTVKILDGEYRLPYLHDFDNITLSAYTMPTYNTPAGWTQPNILQPIPSVFFTDITLFDNCADLTVQGVHFKFTVWIDTTTLDGQTSNPSRYDDAKAVWDDLVWGEGAPYGFYEFFDSIGHSSPPTNGANGGVIISTTLGCDNLVFEDCRLSYGWGPDQEPFDTSGINPDTGQRYADFQSGAFASVNSTNGLGATSGQGDTYQTWWYQDDNLIPAGTPQPTPPLTTPNGRAYNLMKSSPRGFWGDSEDAPPTFRRFWVHDLNTFINATSHAGKIAFDQCWFERMYTDNITGSWFGEGATIPYNDSGFSITRTVMANGFGAAADSGNAHSDFVQGGVQKRNATPAWGRNLFVDRFFCYNDYGSAGNHQALFFRAGAANPPDVFVYDNPHVTNFLQISTGSGVGIRLETLREGLIENSASVMLPGETGSPFIDFYEDLKTPTAIGTPLVRNVTMHGAGNTALGATENLVLLGSSYATIPYANILTGPWPPSATTADGFFNSAKFQAAYASAGIRYSTLQSFLLDDIDLSWIEPFVRFKGVWAAPLSSLQTSSPSTIRGPLNADFSGQDLELSVDTGEFQVTEWDASVIEAWTSSPFDTTSRELVALRHTTPTRTNAATYQTLTIDHATQGAHEFVFFSRTAESITFPRIRRQNNTGTFMSASASLGASNAKTTFATYVRFTQGPTTSRFLWGSSGSCVALYTVAASASDTSAPFTLQIRSTRHAAMVAASKVRFGDLYLLVYSGDITAGVARAYMYNLTTAGYDISFPTINTFTGPTYPYSTATTHGFPSYVDGSLPDFEYVFQIVGYAVDPTPFNPDVVMQFSRAYMGPNGQGPFGVTPEIFLCGANAASWSNLGSGPAFTNTSSAMADYSTPQPTYYPTLELLADPDGPLSVAISEPMSFTLKPHGTTSQANVVVTPASDKAGSWDAPTYTLPRGTDGVTATFTPSASGAHSITFTNNSSLTNPAAQTLAVGGPVAPSTGTQTLGQSSITTAQTVTVSYVLNAPAIDPVVITPTCANGTFSPDPVTITAGQSEGSTVYTPASTGVKTIDATASGITFSPADLSLTVTSAGPTSYTQGLSDTTVAPNFAVTITFTLNTAAVAETTITPSFTSLAEGDGEFSPPSVTIGIGQTVGTVEFTPFDEDTYSIAASNDRSMTNPAAEDLTCVFTDPGTVLHQSISRSSTSVGTHVTLTYTIDGQIPADIEITPSFTPPSLSGTWSAPTATIEEGALTTSLTFTPTAPGLFTISASPDHGLTAPSTVTLSAGYSAHRGKMKIFKRGDN